jgi:hypothetical protein
MWFFPYTAMRERASSSSMARTSAAITHITRTDSYQILSVADRSCELLDMEECMYMYINIYIVFY